MYLNRIQLFCDVIVRFDSDIKVAWKLNQFENVVMLIGSVFKSKVSVKSKSSSGQC